MNTQESRPARAAAAATAPARLPVEEHERVVKPKVRAASSAMATEFQASDEASSYNLSHQPGWVGSYNSARVPGDVRNSTIEVPRPVIDFQAGGNF